MHHKIEKIKVNVHEQTVVKFKDLFINITHVQKSE